MARITADYLIRHLAQAGFVLMRKLPGAAPTAAAGMPAISMLSVKTLKCVDPAAILPDHNVMAAPFARFCDGLLVSVALSVGSGNRFILTIDKEEAVKRHNCSPLVWPRVAQTEQALDDANQGATMMVSG